MQQTLFVIHNKGRLARKEIEVFGQNFFTNVDYLSRGLCRSPSSSNTRDPAITITIQDYSELQSHTLPFVSF